MRAAITFIAFGLLLAGCNNDQPAPPTKKISVRSDEQEWMHKANALNRAIALKRAIYDSGHTCKRLDRSGFIGTYKNLDVWMASCSDKRDWAIYVGSDGSAQVRDCKNAAELDLPLCEIKSEEASGGTVG
ncbi:MAG TPA: hypothetical protein VFP53_05555 [Sphingomicrobium sp.]|nr:hypothetical protein [Sphingomicrobium sp.]